VRIAVSGKFLDGGVPWVHWASFNRAATFSAIAYGAYRVVGNKRSRQRALGRFFIWVRDKGMRITIAIVLGVLGCAVLAACFHHGQTAVIEAPVEAPVYK
jgi:hypothetical protein